MEAQPQRVYTDIPVLGIDKCAVPGCQQPKAMTFNTKFVCQFHGGAAVQSLMASQAFDACPIILKVKKLREDAITPHYAHPGEDSGMDLFSCMDVGIAPGAFVLIPSGIAIELWAGVEAQVRSRSGMAAKHGVFVLNSPGTIDNGYRGEIGVVLCNGGPKEYLVRKGDKIAQLVIAKFTKVEMQVVEELTPSDRGPNGLGSTGL